MKGRKGVYFSFDAIIASIIFILTVISLLSYWYSVRETVISEDSLLMDEALRISNIMFIPAPADQFGFSVSYTDKSINFSKLEYYSSPAAGKDMDDLKQDVATPFNFYIIFEFYNSTSNPGILFKDPDVEFALGEAPSSDALSVAKITRVAPVDVGYLTITYVYVYE